MRGRIKNIVGARGFGFIRGEDNGEYFFHRDEYDEDWGHLEAQVVLGNTDVTFDVSEIKNKGPRAKNMKLALMRV